MFALTFAQDYAPSGFDAPGSIGSVFGALVDYGIAVIELWPVFTRAGRPGLERIIPTALPRAVIRTARARRLLGA